MEINSMNIFYLVGLAETIIKMRGFATYVPPSLSSATYLPHPATTCQFHTLYLPLPASLYLPLHYLPLPGSYLRLPIPATVSTCHNLTLPPPATTTCCLPLSVTTSLPASTSICHHLQLPTCFNLSPDPVAEIATTETIQQTKDQDTKQPSKVPPGGSDPEYLLFGLFF